MYGYIDVRKTSHKHPEILYYNDAKNDDDRWEKKWSPGRCNKLSKITQKIGKEDGRFKNLVFTWAKILMSYFTLSS